MQYHLDFYHQKNLWVQQWDLFQLCCNKNNLVHSRMQILKKQTLNQVLIILEPPFLTIKVIRIMPATNTAEYEVAMMHSCRMYKQMTNTPSCTL